MTGRFRVFWTEPDNYGEDVKNDIKLFEKKEVAQEYFEKLKRRLRGELVESGDAHSLVLEDVVTDEVLVLWRFEDGEEVGSL